MYQQQQQNQQQNQQQHQQDNPDDDNIRCKNQPLLSLVGPLFVSMGDVQQLQLFLEKNPYVPKEHIFVDGYDFHAYKAIGLGRLDEQTIRKEEEDDDNYNYNDNIVKKKQALMTMTMPTLEGGWRGWWNGA